MSAYLECGITLNSQNVNANQSNISVWVNVVASGATWNGYSPSGSVTISGNLSTTQSFSHPFYQNQRTRLYTGTFNVNHNADGSAYISVSASFNTGVSPGTIRANASSNLKTIPRASTVTVSGTIAMGNTITINTNRASSSFTHTIRMNYGYVDVKSYTGVGASVQVPLNVADYAPHCTEKASRQLWIYCKTFNGSTQIGSETMTAVDLAVPSSVVPTVSALSCSDVNGFFSKFGSRYISGKSSIKATAKAAGAYGSTISSYQFELVALNGANGVSLTGTANNATLGIPTESGTRTVRVTVTDTRGRTASRTMSITVSPYSPPNITSFSAQRWANSKPDDESTTVHVSLTASGTATVGTVANSYTVKVESAAYSGTPAYTTKGTYTNTGASFTRTADFTGYASTTDYIFRVTVTDSLGSVVQRSVNTGTATPILDFLPDDLDLGVFRTATNWSSTSNSPGADKEGSNYVTHGMHVNGNVILYNEKALKAYDTYTNDSGENHANLITSVFPSVKKFSSNVSTPFYQGATGLAYPWIPVGQYLSTGDLFGSELDIFLGESSSGYRQMFLKKGGLRGSVYTRIWSGTYDAKGGSALTIENIDRYNLFAVMVETSKGDQISAVCARRTAEDTIATGCCWWHNFSNYICLVGVQMRLTTTGVSDMKASEFLHTGGVLSTVWCNSIKNVVGIL